MFQRAQTPVTISYCLRKSTNYVNIHPLKFWKLLIKWYSENYLLSLRSFHFQNTNNCLVLYFLQNVVYCFSSSVFTILLYLICYIFMNMVNYFKFESSRDLRISTTIRYELLQWFLFFSNWIQTNNCQIANLLQNDTEYSFKMSIAHLPNIVLIHCCNG